MRLDASVVFSGHSLEKKQYVVDAPVKLFTPILHLDISKTPRSVSSNVLLIRTVPLQNGPAVHQPHTAFSPANAR
jgi:hypothetical protein